MIHVEPWPTTTSGPYLITDDTDDPSECAIVEDGGTFPAHAPSPTVAGPGRLAFIDGVRRGDARLYLSQGRALAHGIAGAHGTGAVVCEPEQRPRFHACRVERMVVWGSGVAATLPPQPGGWSWTVDTVTDDRPDAPLHRLQRRMRESEGRLAEGLVADGWVVVIDGPLNFVRSRDLPIVGLVKTHHQQLLPPDQHLRVTELRSGERSGLFAKRHDIYSCYVRLAAPPPWAGPWAGIARLEIPASTGLDVAVTVADQATALLPRFAGVAHKDDRAPQNLLPVARLERHLRRLLGDGGLAVRAIRTAAMAASSREASA